MVSSKADTNETFSDTMKSSDLSQGLSGGAKSSETKKFKP